MARFASGVKFLFLVIGLLPVVAGCGGKTGDGFTGARGQVSGTITLDGEPLKKGCQVIFVSNKGGYTASGVVEDKGKYSLVYSGGKGLPTGEYLAQLTAPVVPASKQAVDPGQMGATLKIDKKTNKEAGKSDDGRPFPVRYESTLTSMLPFNVVAGPNTADFKLETKKK